MFVLYLFPFIAICKQCRTRLNEEPADQAPCSVPEPENVPEEEMLETDAASRKDEAVSVSYEYSNNKTRLPASYENE